MIFGLAADSTVEFGPYLPARDFSAHRLLQNAFFGQFFARAFGLIAVPIFFYLLWFYIHFAALYRSGPGDAFMSHRFQAELKGGAALMNSFPVPYYTNVSFRHQLTSVFLHSHPDRYPLRYDDGRVSSAGQQVTGYPHKDANNIFILEPADPTLYPNATRIHPDDARTGVRFLRNGDIFRMLHVLTNSRLITHDVASPLMSTHMEVTTIPVEDDPRRYEETLWRVEAENLRAGERIRSIGQYLKIVNVVHRVAIHTHTGALPAWAFGQQEINGNKNMQERANMWFVEDVQVEYDEETPGGSFFAQAAEDMDYDPIEGLETDLPEEMVDEGEEEWKPDEDNEYDPKTLVHTPATATGAPVPRGTVAPPPPQIAIHDEQPDPLGE